VITTIEVAEWQPPFLREFNNVDGQDLCTWAYTENNMKEDDRLHIICTNKDIIIIGRNDIGMSVDHYKEDADEPYLLYTYMFDDYCEDPIECDECGKEMSYAIKDMDGTNLEEVYECSCGYYRFYNEVHNEES